MPTMNNYLIFSYVNLAFIIQIGLLIYFTSVQNIRDNWQEYRCNPPYWIYSENVSEDFNYCVQNTQTNLMGHLLEPITYTLSSISSMNNNMIEAVNNARGMISYLRDSLTNIIQTVFGSFLSLIIQFQKMIIGIGDVFGKLIGILTTLMYVVDSLYKTAISVYKGPIVQTMFSLGSCFHPDTKVKLKNGTILSMSELPLGAEFEDGSKIFAVLKIDNANKNKLYKIKGGINNEDIYVTGQHFIYDTKQDKFVQVKDYNEAYEQDEITSEWFSCLITTNRRIQIGEHIFWDWEDDEIINKIPKIPEI
jgi:hypothetical protein